jgi:hypothetical protein
VIVDADAYDRVSRPPKMRTTVASWRLLAPR